MMLIFLTLKCFIVTLLQNPVSLQNHVMPFKRTKIQLKQKQWLQALKTIAAVFLWFLRAATLPEKTGGFA